MGYIGAGISRFNTADELTVTGDAEFNGNANFGDSDKAQFGAGNDLQIYHDGSNSYIDDAGAGDLFIRASNNHYLRFMNGDYAITTSEDGDVGLRYDNSQKLVTTSSGIDVTGVITTDGMTTSADINFGDNDKAIFGAGNDLQIYHDGSASRIVDAGTGGLTLQADANVVIQNSAGTETKAEFTTDGAVNLYYDTALKLATTATGVAVNGNAKLTGTGRIIKFDKNGSGEDNAIYYDNTTADNNLFVGRDSSNVAFRSGGSERMRLDSSGNFLVGQSSQSVPGFSNNTVGHSIRPNGDIFSSCSGGEALYLNRSTNDGGIVSIRRQGTQVGVISVTTSGTTYSTTSDRRLKSNIEDAASASDKIDAIQVRQFDWNADDSHQEYGLIAQELQPIEPMAVTGDADSDEMMGVDYSKLVPMLIKEIQELRGRVATLEAN